MFINNNRHTFHKPIPPYLVTNIVEIYQQEMKHVLAIILSFIVYMFIVSYYCYFKILRTEELLHKKG